MENDTEDNKDKEMIMREIHHYFNGPLTNDLNTDDISYNEWGNNDPNIKFLINEIIVNNDNVSSVFSFHDCKCELMLLKWITEDTNHKANFTKIHNPNLLKPVIVPEHLPYQFNLVKVNPSKEAYYNACYINGPFSHDNQFFIAAQTPTEDSIEEFWTMIYNHPTITTVIRLSSSDDEDDVEYWPRIGTTLKYPKMNINVNSEEPLITNALTRREFEIYDKENDWVRNIQQFTGNDLTLGSKADSFSIAFEAVKLLLMFIHEEGDKEPIVNKATKNNIGHPCPRVLIHSNNNDHIGALICISNIIKCLEEQKKYQPLSYYVNIFNPIRKLKEQRLDLMTNASFYQFVYDYCLKTLKHLLQE